jgi:hypothetical protein
MLEGNGRAIALAKCKRDKKNILVLGKGAIHIGMRL